jgi:hypothetical protein
MRQNLTLDRAEFKDFDAVHACLSTAAIDWQSAPILEAQDRSAV